MAKIMKKKFVVFICIGIILMFFTNMCYHFKINPENITLENVEIYNNETIFDVYLRVGFFDVTDYSVKIEGDCMYLNFYGSYLFLKPFYKPVNRVTLKTKNRINRIISNDGKTAWWESENISE